MEVNNANIYELILEPAPRNNPNNLVNKLKNKLHNFKFRDSDKNFNCENILLNIAQQITDIESEK